MTTDPQAFNEDEDLFAFPDIAGLEPLAEDTIRAFDSDTPRPASTRDPIDTVSPETASMNIQKNTANAHQDRVESEIAAMQDDDLFGFDESLLEPLGDSPPKTETPEPLTPPPVPVSKQEESATAPTVESAPQSTPVHTTPTKSAPVQTQEVEASTEPAPVTASPKTRPRLVEALAACFLLANAALILFAWRAGDDFRQALDNLSEDLQETVHAGQSHRPQPPILSATVPAPVPVPLAQTTYQGPLVPTPALNSSLSIAREDMDNGFYSGARMNLGRLLALRDANGLTDELAIEAERMIALSYHLEAQALQQEEN